MNKERRRRNGFLKEVSVLRNDYASRQEKLLASIDSRVNSVLEELDGRLPSLIVGIIENVLGGIELNAQMIENSVKGLLVEFGKDDEQLEVFLCPDDLALLKSMADKDTAPSAESDAEGSLVPLRESLMELTAMTNCWKVIQM